MEDFLFALSLALLAVAALGIYVLPAVIAFFRRHPYRWPLAVVNVFLGWTLIGYATCFAVAVWPKPGRNNDWR